MRDILDEYGALIISAIAAVVVVGLIVALFYGTGSEIVTSYMNNSI